jgi:hypothetical protein
MKIREMVYTKKDGATKPYKVLVIKEDATHIEGISLGDLSEEGKEKVIAIYKKFEEELEPFMKNYRMFLKSGIVMDEKGVTQK